MDNTDQPAQNTQPVSQPPVGHTHSSKTKLILIGLGILFVLGLGGAYVLGTRNNQSDQNQTQTAVSPTVPQPTTISDTTADWETFTTDTYTFRYPKEFKKVQPLKDCSAMLEMPNVGDESIYLTICPHSYTPEQLIQIDGEKHQVKKQPIILGKYSGIRSDLSTRQEDQSIYQARVFLGDFGEAKGGEGQKKRTLAIRLFIIDGPQQEEQALATFERMLATFKFTDQAQAGDAANWRSYSDEVYSFQYPKDWKVRGGYSDYFKGNEVIIENPNKSVVINMTPQQLPYGLEGEFNTPTKTTNLTITIEGKPYAVKEEILNNKNAFVDFKVTKKGDHFILFGTGYPSGEDRLVSLSDYKAARDTILQILSSLKINE